MVQPSLRTAAESPRCSEAETAGIASIHPEYQEDEVVLAQNLHIPEASVSRGPEKKSKLYDMILGKTSQDEKSMSSNRDRGPEDPSLAESFRYRSGSGHEDIQSLAEHYKGRSRSASSATFMPGQMLWHLPVPSSQYLCKYVDMCRRLAAARELSSAASSEERADVILDHQLMDIDSI